MITAASLKSYTVKDLAQMAKSRGLSGWHSMRKDQLVRALVKAGKSQSAKAQKSSAKKASASKAKVTTKAKAKAPSTRKPARAKKKELVKPTSAAALRKIRNLHSQREESKDISSHTVSENGDRMIVMVRDPFWLHVYWEVTRQSVDRVRAAMAEHWHGAKPVLQLIEVDGGSTTSTAERVVREIEIHGGVKNWYIDVVDPPKSYRVLLGYVGVDERFYPMVRSNVVTTPRPGTSDEIDGNWTGVAENVDKIYALSGGNQNDVASDDLKQLFEERLHRPVGTPLSARIGAIADRFSQENQGFNLQVEVEIVIHGQTKKGSQVTLKGEPVKVNDNGAFMVKMDLPDKRQIFPIVARSQDGVEQRTIALAIERNTKIMDPVTYDGHV
ncbi:MAG: DUF4912 domain-containing protein [Blastopirellula sp.]|nr:MAG: DUF4912 domain-containing protein [Blastopirellula sp.]